MVEEQEKRRLPKGVILQSILIGILFGGDNIFGFFEQNFFNTYLPHVLGLWDPFYVTIMVSLSAAMGLVANLSWGIISDNTRSRFGRRRPYIFVGGIIAGVAMVTFAFADNYLIALVLDVVIIGIASNAYYVTERALIPDKIDLEYRGRANGIVNIIGYIGLLIAIAGFLIVNELFSQEVFILGEMKSIITHEGYIVVLLLGGGAFLFCAFTALIAIKDVPPSELPPKQGFFEEFKKIFDIQEFRKNREFFKLTLAYTIFRCGIGSIMPFLFWYILGLNLSTLELVFSVLFGFPILFIIIYVLGRLADKYGRKKHISISIIIIAVGLIMVLFVNQGSSVNMVLFFLTFPFILIALLGLITPINAWTQDMLPEDKRGKFYGILNIIFTIPQIIGSMAAGIVITIGGILWIFPLGAVFFLSSILFFRRVEETVPTTQNSG
ncbi:MAG: MFS transporter [Promethearchaeota archaeon]